MSTIRRQITDFAATLAANATTLTLFRNLDYAIEERRGDVLVVTSGSDGQIEGLIGAVTEAFTEVNFSIVVANDADPELIADGYEVQIHAALVGDFRCSGLALNMERVSGDWDFTLGDCCVRTLTYRYLYRTAFSNLETTA